MTAAQVQALGDQALCAAEARLRVISQDRALRIQYERQHQAAIDAGARIADALIDGKREGKLEGKREGKLETLLMLCRTLGIELPTEHQARLAAGEPEAIDRIAQHVVTHRALP